MYLKKENFRVSGVSSANIGNISWDLPSHFPPASPLYPFNSQVRSRNYLCLKFGTRLKSWAKLKFVIRMFLQYPVEICRRMDKWTWGDIWQGQHSWRWLHALPVDSIHMGQMWLWYHHYFNRYTKLTQIGLVKINNPGHWSSKEQMG